MMSEFKFSGAKTATTRSSPRNTVEVPPLSTPPASSRASSSRPPPSTTSWPVPNLKRVREEERTPVVPAAPAVEPVEQRWEESEGKYMHKKFKKMASSVQLPAAEGEPNEAPAPVPSLPPPVRAPPPHQVSNAAPVFNHFPLKHSALSLVQTASAPAPVTHAALISSSYRPSPSMSYHPTYTAPPPAPGSWWVAPGSFHPF